MDKSIKIEDGDFLIINPNTGELINTFGEGDRIIHKERIEYANENIINFNKGVSFVKLYDKTISVLRKKLTPTEFTIAFSLCEYVSYKDCVLRSNGKIMTMKDISELLDIDYGVIRRVTSALVKKGVLGIHKTGCIDKPNILIKAIVCNPYIFSRGVDVNRVIAGLFEKSGWDKYIE